MRLKIAYPPQRASAALMRDALRTYLLAHSLDQRIVQEVVLAAEEAMINAVTHAGDGGGKILVCARVRRGEARVEVRDIGCGFDVREVDLEAMPDLERPCGRGLYLMHMVMDEVRIKSGDHGTSVHMVRHVA